MPTYEYACESCGKKYEKREGFDAPARQKCQFCGKTANRLLFAPPVVFKGSGFYKTDSRGSSGATADTPPSTESAKSTSDSAPATPVESKPAKTDATETAAAG